MCKADNTQKGMKFDIPDFYDLEQAIIESVEAYMKQKKLNYIDTSDSSKAKLPFIEFVDGDEENTRTSHILAVRVDCDELEILTGGDPTDELAWTDIHSDSVYYADALMSLAGGLPEFTKDYESTKRTYTFRFHRHAWTDITVEANDEETAQRLADEKYNEGDYDDSDEDFENTHMELLEAE